MINNTAHYSMARWKPEEERLRSDIASANIATTYIPKVPNQVRPLHDSPASYRGHVVVVALVEEAEDASAAEVDGTFVLHATQRTYFLSGAQRLATVCCTVWDNRLLRPPF
jgi:hypothetical protein